jgi:predicted nucleic acid-binding protein
VIFVDSNIPMYLIGTEHPNKARARRALERAITDGEHLVSDVEVLQEVLHRYVAINRRDAIGPAFDALLGTVHELYPIELVDVEAARRLVTTAARLSARDAIHVAVMQRRGIGRVLSFDRAFDGLPGLERITQ